MHTTWWWWDDLCRHLHTTPVPGDSGAQLWKHAAKEIRAMYMSKDFTPMLLILMARYLGQQPEDLLPIFPRRLLCACVRVSERARAIKRVVEIPITTRRHTGCGSGALQARTAFGSPAHQRASPQTWQAQP